MAENAKPSLDEIFGANPKADTRPSLDSIFKGQDHVPSIAERMFGKALPDEGNGGLMDSLWNKDDSNAASAAYNAVKEELTGRTYPGRPTAQPNDTDSRGVQWLMPAVMGPRGMGMLSGSPTTLSSFSNAPSAAEVAMAAKDKLASAAVAGKGLVSSAAEKAWDFAKDQSKGLLGKAAIGKLLYDQFRH